MERWFKRLRKRAKGIRAGSYQPRPGNFEGAPLEVALLGEELDALARAMADRDRIQRALTYEVHHRVKNNLQLVSSLLNIQASKIQDPATLEALGQTRARMGALALIHRLLYEQADDGTGARINIASLITELCAQLRLWYRDRGSIRFTSDASAIDVPIETAIPLTLFAVEAVTNAYRHAFPDSKAGAVSLHFSVDRGQSTLRVADDGVGFEIESHSKSMGRLLMNAFAHQLGGQVEIAHNKPSGTIVTLGFAVSS